MNVTARIDLLEQIGRTLQARYTFADLHGYFAALNIPTPRETFGSKRNFAKEALKAAQDETLLKIAEELGLKIHPSQGAAIVPPRNWKDTTLFRIFISHISKDKDKATRLKACLEPYAISAFVAHEDIHPTLEWQIEVERALYVMDAFIAIHTEGFSQSFWTQQEIGFAVGQGVKIISFKMGEDPTGFVSRRQALPHRRRLAEEIAKEIDALLADDDLTAVKLHAAKLANGRRLRSPCRDAPCAHRESLRPIGFWMCSIQHRRHESHKDDCWSNPGRPGWSSAAGRAGYRTAPRCGVEPWA
jgi:hypothetical protein